MPRKINKKKAFPLSEVSRPCAGVLFLMELLDKWVCRGSNKVRHPSISAVWMGDGDSHFK